MDNFRAWMVDVKVEDRKDRIKMVELAEGDLPAGDVTVRVEYSCLNYKDAAAITGAGKILRVERCVPGIDFAGTVAKSADGGFKEGDAVLVTGFGVGEERHGGLAEYARVPAGFATRMPDGLDARKAMSFGTAGFTAGLSILSLIEHGVKQPADVVVTSIGGGVGSLSAALVSKLGYKLHAVTRKKRHEYARTFRPASIIDREDYVSGEIKPLAKERWDAGIDTAGGQVLAKLLSEVKSEGIVSCCGLTAGAAVNTTVMPFILRGITLRGINSVHVPQDDRPAVWDFLSEHQQVLDDVNIKEVGFDEVQKEATELIRSNVLGRILVRVAS